MKKNVLALAFMLMLASTTAFADGETGHGGRYSGKSSVATNQVASSTNLLDQIFNAIYALVA